MTRSVVGGIGGANHRDTDNYIKGGEGARRWGDRLRKFQLVVSMSLDVRTSLNGGESQLSFREREGE